MFHDLDRFSVDLDFDVQADINIKTNIEQSLKGIVKVKRIDSKKWRDVSKKYTVKYTGKQGQGQLKIDLSYRNKHIPSHLYTQVDDIQVYTLKELLSQKLVAVENRSKVRDVYDVWFLLKKHLEAFSLEMATQLVEATKDPDSLVDEMSPELEQDRLLHGIDMRHVVHDLRERAEAFVASHGAG